MEHNENFEDTWEAKEIEWLSYVKNDVLSTAFCYARNTIVMENLIRFGMKNSITLPSSAIRFFSSLRDENDETIYTYTEPFMRKSVRKTLREDDAQLHIIIINLSFLMLSSILFQLN